MADLTSLKIHYDHWDRFVREWQDGRFERALHLPEPWWGWCPQEGTLQSVTINLSPGPGGKLQMRRCIGCAAGCCNKAYSVMMHDGTLRNHLNETERWHLERRYLPLMNAIKAKKIATDTTQHLSIELRPFHNNECNDEYLHEHREDIINHSLLFAAKAAQLIESDKPDKKEPDKKEKNGSEQEENSLSLRNIVIVRAAFDRIKKYLGSKKCKEIIEELPSVKIDHATAFTLRREKYGSLADVWFVCITGARNNFPGGTALEEIIKKIINHINESKPQV